MLTTMFDFEIEGVLSSKRFFLSNKKILYHTLDTSYCTLYSFYKKQTGNFNSIQEKTHLFPRILLVKFVLLETYRWKSSQGMSTFDFNKKCQCKKLLPRKLFAEEHDNGNEKKWH